MIIAGHQYVRESANVFEAYFLVISSLYVCMVNIKLKYNFIIISTDETLLLALMKIQAYGSKALR